MNDYIKSVRPSSNNQTRMFPSKTIKKRRLMTGIKNMQSIFSLIYSFIFCIFMLKTLPMLFKSGMKDIYTANNFEKKIVDTIWQNLTDAKGLKELALGENLQKTAQDIIYKIQNPQQYFAKGGMQKNSILLYGPAGTGKTTFAKAIAKEIPDSAFASIDLSAVQGKFVGQTEDTLNNIVDKICAFADQNPNTKVFTLIDEIDTLALEDNGSANQQYWSSVLNTLKKCLSEKLGARKNIITFASSNIDVNFEKEAENSLKQISKPILDRFSQRIKVDMPTTSQFQKAISRHYAPLSLVDNCLKKETSPEVVKIAQILEDKKYSFRTLETLYDVSASIDKTGSNLTFENILQAINKISSDENKNCGKIGFVA